MSITYGFFNALNSDRVYNADQMSQYFDGLVSDGVYENVGGAFQVLAGTGMNVNVQSGRAIIRCKWVASDAVETLSITAAHATLKRITAVILRLDTSARTITLTTKDGTPASNPTPPAMTDSATVKELCLARVLVNPGVTSITQANITDTRAASVCGWVTGIIQQVDTSTLFLQWQTAYEEYFADMEAWFTDRKNAFDAWMATLTDELTIGAYIKQYVYDGAYTSTAGTPVSLSTLVSPAYTWESTDIVQVTLNGLTADEGTDYTVSNGNITFTNSASFSHIRITILKAVLGVSS